MGEVHIRTILPTMLWVVRAVPVVERPDIHRLELLPVARGLRDRGIGEGTVIIVPVIIPAVVAAPAVPVPMARVRPMVDQAWQIRFWAPLTIGAAAAPAPDIPFVVAMAVSAAEEEERCALPWVAPV